jgi:NADPH-dependent 2,4-dienoyl-CoA reductase/sulfur reductase-like enzyme/rhodanese-related sulfurtransferase
MAQSFRVVVIGGVAAGPKIAAKVARLRPDAEVTLIEKGEHLSYAGCGLTYYISDMVKEQKDLMATPAGVVRDPAFFKNVKNVTVHNRTEALEIDRKARRVRLRSLADGREWWIAYDKLALATGARAVIPPIPGVDLPNVFILKSIEDAEKIKSVLAQQSLKDVVIVGGGLIGVEAAEALVAKGAHVTLIEMLPQILLPLDPEMAVHVQKHITAKGVDLLTGTKVEAIAGGDKVEAIAGGDKVEAVVAGDRRIACDAVIVAVGVRPEIELAKQAGLKIGRTGAIRVSQSMRTSDPRIYAAGDCAETTHLVTGKPCWVPLGSTANKQGRVAAINLCGGNERFPGVLGSTIVKVFDFNVGLTGLSEKAAREAGYDAVTCLVPAADRADYYPGKKMLMLKLIADRATGRLLGAQAVGPGEAAKRLDVAATAITAGMTVEQVSKLDLCYAPPYSAALDNIITAANVIRNKIEGRIVGISPIDLAWKIEGQEDILLLDVRTPAEFEKGHLKDAVHIPLGALRKRAGELPRDREIVVYCGSSLRAYEGALILRHAGLEHVKVLDGSVAMWPYELVK